MTTKTKTKTPKGKQLKGFAIMPAWQQHMIACMGGKTVSKDRKHMARIGRKGGLNSHGRHG